MTRRAPNSTRGRARGDKALGAVQGPLSLPPTRLVSCSQQMGWLWVPMVFSSPKADVTKPEQKFFLSASESFSTQCFRQP